MANAAKSRGAAKKSGSPAREIPDKLYFRIGEVAKLLAVPAYVLRFWEKEFPTLKPGKGGTGQRLYRRRDVETLLRIRALLYDEGFTIPGARQHLKLQTKSEAAAEPTAETADSTPVHEETSGPAPSIRLRQLRAELRELSAMLTDGPPPEAGPGKGKAAHRGLHLASSRKRTLSQSASLFPDFALDTSREDAQ